VDVAALAIVGAVAVALVAIVAMARRRAWNADGSDDARRGRTPVDPPQRKDAD
jgi:heme/copper-type cytochrome/quinol oxidase subunit 2